MADREDEILHALAHGISVTYSLMVEVCEALPVPISLPSDRHIPVANAVPAIQRAAALAKDQPMSESQEAHLYYGCVYLLASIDLYALTASRYEETRAEAVGANLAQSETHLKALLVSLLTNDG
ncbi:hypothetical protein ACIGMX_12610 [Streptomyces aquilus]|uniref:hypothetical protein n=1 Tax=Streptomyces aquilus TaxID=2548456 RepID=UPI0037D78844